MIANPAEKVKNTKESTRPVREDIKGLPPHAQYQKQGKTLYVYFPYCFSINGKREQERDYIGTLSPDGREFRPNLYYVQKYLDYRCKNPMDAGCPSGSTSSRRFPGGLIFLKAR